MDIITIGDGMITFDPKSKGPLRFVNQFERKIGGAELNVIIGCARLGIKTGWISRLGKDEFGRHILNTVRGEGIDVSEVELMEGYATSLNFKEVQESGSGKTFYYRKHSPTETLTPDLLPEDYIKKAKVLHVTGVFPAIDDVNSAVILKALQVAKANNVKISFDPNIRLKLWSKEKARATILTYLPYVDYLLAGRDELELLFETNHDAKLIEKLQEFSIEQVVIKDGENGCYFLEKDNWTHFPGVKVSKVVDTVGAGDGFNAGFLYGTIKKWDLNKTMRFANTIGALVVQVPGDNEGLPYLEEVEEYMGEREMIER
ncbi:2-dehydro-3-deoxygluconokinase [Planomicrobium soli]|uniref:2-dehydro-3-deoxygluconokinase n=1 Tax=Planomicrobium soli TaxID=1176648 RepID=A0A2P8H1V2_9BACL|nr:sugar kinase [Planomicrobium soli]PSL40185.1 2-dehydro-3-deoxygluconokinase [Planomicrobium soli]